MQIAIDAGFDNPDPAVQEEWKKMTLKGDRPTPEEVINYAVKKLKEIKNMKKKIIAVISGTAILIIAAGSIYGKLNPVIKKANQM